VFCDWGAMGSRMGAAAATALALVTLAAAAASAQAASIFTLAGAADPFVDCPGGYTAERARWLGLPATEVPGLCAGPGLAALPNGDLVLGVRGKLVRLDGNGVVHHLAGGSPSGPLGDAGPATAAALLLGERGGLAVDATGGVLVSDTSDGDRVRRVAPDGAIATVGGNGDSSYSAGSEVPDGAPATSGPLSAAALAPTADGGFALVTGDYRRIRAVGPDGIVTTLAGGEGQPPLPEEVTALAPMASGGLAFAADGTVYALEPCGSARPLPGFPAGVHALASAPGGGLLAGTASQAWLVEPSGAARLVAGRSEGEPLDLVGRGDGRMPERAGLSIPPGNSLAALADGSFALLDGQAGNGFGDHVRIVTPIPSARLAAEILPWTLASRGKVLVSYVVTQAANVEVSVRHRGREIVRAAQAAAPGKNVLPLGRRLPDGQNVITLTARAGSARTTDHMAMLPNGFLPRRAATAVIPTGEDESEAPYGTPVGNAAARPRAADTYSIVYIVACRRFSRSRVDCVRHETDTVDSFDHRTGFTVRLGHNGRVYVRTYAKAGKSDRNPRFYRRPHWLSRTLATAPVLILDTRD
jgi:hypothetical protein